MCSQQPGLHVLIGIQPLAFAGWGGNVNYRVCYFSVGLLAKRPWFSVDYPLFRKEADLKWGLEGHGDGGCVMFYVGTTDDINIPSNSLALIHIASTLYWEVGGCFTQLRYKLKPMLVAPDIPAEVLLSVHNVTAVCTTWWLLSVCARNVAAIDFDVMSMSTMLMIPSTHALFLCIFALSCFTRVQHQRKNDRIFATTAKVALVGRRFVVTGFVLGHATGLLHHEPSVHERTMHAYESVNPWGEP